MNRISDIQGMTENQIALRVRQLYDDIRELRHAIHDLGPSGTRDDAIASRREEIDELERELAHRRKDRMNEANG